MNELTVTIIPAQISANLAEIKAELLRLRCEPNATREDAENTLNQIISENYGEVLRIDSVIEE